MPFDINLWSIKTYFWSPRISGVTKSASLLRSTREDLLKSNSYMFPSSYKFLTKFSKVKSDLISEINNSKYLSVPNLAKQSRGLGVAVEVSEI